MSMISPNPRPRMFWPLTWLFVTLVILPLIAMRFAVALFPSLPTGWLLLFGLVILCVGVLVWFYQHGGGWRLVEYDSVMIIRNRLNNKVRMVSAGEYLMIPLLHRLEARLPIYAFRFEFDVSKIDTNTFLIGQIDRVRMRLYCRLRDGQYKRFFHKVSSRLDVLRTLQQEQKLSVTDHQLWKGFMTRVISELGDDVLRDVVWTWPEPVERNPAALSKKRLDLAMRIERRLEKELEVWGIEMLPCSATLTAADAAAGVAATTGAPAAAGPPDPAAAQPPLRKLVLEQIDVKFEIIRESIRDYQWKLNRANEDAHIDAAALRQRGFAEAEIRARTLSLLLDELINQRGLTMNDPLVAEMMRATLYSDGQMIWHSVIEKGSNGKSG